MSAYIRRWPSHILLLMLVLALTACASQQTTAPSGTDHSQAGHAPAASAPFDQQFIDMMVPHHEGAVAMARIALTRAEHPELRQMAEAIIRDQDREIGLMKGWRKSWYGSDQTPPMNKMPMLPGMTHTMMGSIDADLNKLQTTTPFDLAFIDLMIPHHDDAIGAAKLAQQQATHTEIKQLAADILTTQAREIAQMREWRTAWSTSTARPPSTATPTRVSVAPAVSSTPPPGPVSKAAVG